MNIMITSLQSARHSVWWLTRRVVRRSLPAARRLLLRRWCTAWSLARAQTFARAQTSVNGLRGWARVFGQNAPSERCEGPLCVRVGKLHAIPREPVGPR
jgi:hypothetical protein